MKDTYPEDDIWEEIKYNITQPIKEICQAVKNHATQITGVVTLSALLFGPPVLYDVATREATTPKYFVNRQGNKRTVTIRGNFLSTYELVDNNVDGRLDEIVHRGIAGRGGIGTRFTTEPTETEQREYQEQVLPFIKK